MEVSVKAVRGRKERKSNQFYLYRRIFFNESCDSDFMIVSAEGRVFPCHTAVLSSECEVFFTMFRMNWIEVSTTRLALQDMSTEGVEAFLCYLYLKDIEKPRNKFAVAVELFMASHKYMLHDLSAEMKRIILGKTNLAYYSDTVTCIELYKFASIIKEKKLISRTLRLLKKIDHSIENCWKIKEVCQNDPYLVVKLFWDSFSVCTCSGSEDPSEMYFESENDESETEAKDEQTISSDADDSD